MDVYRLYLFRLKWIGRLDVGRHHASRQHGRRQHASRQHMLFTNLTAGAEAGPRYMRRIEPSIESSIQVVVMFFSSIH